MGTEENLLDLKSPLCMESASIRFENVTQRTVEVVWIDFDGDIVPYKTLPPNTCLDVNTFKGHPWLSVDANTKVLLLTDKKKVFIPIAWRELLEQHNVPFAAMTRNFTLPRLRVRITSPMFSLKQLALDSVRKHIIHIEDEVELLDIPYELCALIRSTFVPYTKESVLSNKNR